MPSTRSDISGIQNKISFIIQALKSPHDVSTHTALLAPLLKSIELLPDTYNSNTVSPLPTVVSISKHIPLIQRTLLDCIAPSWEIGNNNSLVEQFFCPTNVPKNVSAVTEVVLFAYSTILSIPLTQSSVHLLRCLSLEHPIDTLYRAIFEGGALLRDELVWEDLVRNMLSIPARVANAFGAGLKGEMPPTLEQAFYINDICLRCERLVAHVSCQGIEEVSVRAITYLFTKLVNQGALPPAPPSARSQPSFFQTTLAAIRGNLRGATAELYSSTWATVLANVPSSLVLQRILQSMFVSLQAETQYMDRLQIQRNAHILQGFFGAAIPDHVRLWECTTGLLVNKEWDEGVMQSIVRWISGASYGSLVNDQAIQALLNVVLNVWVSPLHVKSSPLSWHRYLTGLLLAAISYVPPSSNIAHSVISSPSFLTAVGFYISHTERSIRLCGMLVAEILSSMGGKALSFDIWEGNDEATLWAQRIRQLAEARFVDAVEVDNRGNLTSHDVQFPSKITTEGAPALSAVVDFDSDDSLTGYGSPASLRSISPSLSELDEAEKEPYLNVGREKVPAPFYLSQLIDLLSGNGTNSATEAKKNKVALDSAEGLIRRRKSFGTEMEENASVLVSTFLGLQDNYNLPRFDIKRQAALNALVVSCPHLAAPCLIEEFFKSQYSIAQRFAALEALACGAREMTMPSALSRKTASHRRQVLSACSTEGGYITEGGGSNFRAGESIIKASTRLPCTKRHGSNLTRAVELPMTVQAQIHNTISFTSISIPYFISPLTSRFWSFVRDEKTRESRTASYDGRNRHFGAGTGSILNPIVLAQFLRTLAILVNLSERSVEWLTSVAPDSLEVAVTVGTLPISCTELEVELEHLDSSTTSHLRKEAVTLTAALELALAVLDGCLEADNGEYLSLRYTALLQRTIDWAQEIFSSFRVGGGAVFCESPLLGVATSVVLKADRVMSRWRRSMINLT